MLYEFDIVTPKGTVQASSRVQEAAPEVVIVIGTHSHFYPDAHEGQSMKSTVADP
jgi:hypothetical protein